MQRLIFKPFTERLTFIISFWSIAKYRIGLTDAEDVTYHEVFLVMTHHLKISLAQIQWIQCLHPKNLSTGFFQTFTADSKLQAIIFLKHKIENI